MGTKSSVLSSLKHREKVQLKWTFGSRVIVVSNYARKILHKNHTCPFCNLNSQMYLQKECIFILVMTKLVLDKLKTN